MRLAPEPPLESSSFDSHHIIPTSVILLEGCSIREIIKSDIVIHLAHNTIRHWDAIALDFYRVVGNLDVVFDSRMPSIEQALAVDDDHHYWKARLPIQAVGSLARLALMDEKKTSTSSLIMSTVAFLKLSSSTKPCSYMPLCSTRKELFRKLFCVVTLSVFAGVDNAFRWCYYCYVEPSSCCRFCSSGSYGDHPSHCSVKPLSTIMATPTHLYQ